MYYKKIITDNSQEWILFIHGLGGSINTWKKQIEQFAGKYNLLLVDLDGHGKSKPTETNITYKPKLAAKQINYILEKEDIKKVNIISLSLGTLVALEFIYNYAEKVKSNILAGCIINLDNKRLALLSFVQHIKSYLPPNVLYNVFAHIVLPKENHKLSRDIFIRESLKLDKQSFCDWIDSVNTSANKIKNYIKTINKNNIPTLFITGKEDYMFLDGIKKLKDDINDFKLNIINHCGHVCSIEKANIFNELAMEFLSKHERHYILLPKS